MGGKSRKRGQVSKKLIDRLLRESKGGESKKSGQSKRQKGLL